MVLVPENELNVFIAMQIVLAFANEKLSTLGKRRPLVIEITEGAIHWKIHKWKKARINKYINTAQISW